MNLHGKHRRRLLLPASPLLAALLALYLWRASGSEPAYQGQPMHYWLQKALAGDGSSPELHKAILALGLPAIRSLLEAMTQHDSGLHEKWVEFYPRLPKLFRSIISVPRSGPEQRNSAYSTLNWISDNIKGPEMRPLVPLLAADLSNDDTRPSSSTVDAETHVRVPHGVFVRSVAAEILRNLGPDAAPAVPALIKALDEPAKWKYYPQLPIRTLGAIGPAASNAIPSLRRIMQGKDIANAAFAAESLWRIDPSLKPEVNAFLPTALSSTNSWARLKAARAHWRINSQPEIVLPILTNLLHDTSAPWPDILRALQDLGPAAAPAIPHIQAKTQDPNLGQFAAQVLKTIQSSTENRQ